MSDFADYLKSDAGQEPVWYETGARALQNYVTKEVLTAAPGTRLESWRDLLAHLQRHGELPSDKFAMARALWNRFTRHVQTRPPGASDGL